MKIKNSKGTSIAHAVAVKMLETLPNFDNPEQDLKSLGLTPEMIKRVENGYTTGQPIKKGA
ncbi:MAG: hypothetical protein RR280_01455 [Bacteroidaceae bacterium]